MRLQIYINFFNYSHTLFRKVKINRTKRAKRLFQGWNHDTISTGMNTHLIIIFFENIFILKKKCIFAYHFCMQFGCNRCFIK